jgi:hypothetical protein
MDGQRFDAVARSLATRQTRRGTLRRLAAATGALIAAGIPARPPPVCREALASARTRVTATGHVLAGESIAQIPATGAIPVQHAALVTVVTTGNVPEPA